MQTPLKASPLSIDHHIFLAIQVEASELEKPQGVQSLKTRRKLEPHPEDPRQWMVDLAVEIGTPQGGEPAPYSGKVEARGWFTVAEAFPLERIPALIEVTACSILYGSCREMLANFTARSAHGIVSIPSISFEPINRAPGHSPPDSQAPETGAKKTAET